jgi:hypothetical protein
MRHSPALRGFPGFSQEGQKDRSYLWVREMSNGAEAGSAERRSVRTPKFSPSDLLSFL